MNHMVTMARSKNVSGPYESYTGNPVLTNANTTSYCEVPQSPEQILGHADLLRWIVQTVGHADLFQDSNGNW